MSCIWGTLNYLPSAIICINLSRESRRLVDMAAIDGALNFSSRRLFTAIVDIRSEHMGQTYDCACNPKYRLKARHTYKFGLLAQS
jgi:hypothetical protein